MELIDSEKIAGFEKNPIYDAPAKFRTGSKVFLSKMNKPLTVISCKFSEVGRIGDFVETEYVYTLTDEYGYEYFAYEKDIEEYNEQKDKGSSI